MISREVTQGAPDDHELMRAHVAALYVHDDRGRMTHVNEPGGQRAPRFFIGRTRAGVEWRVRDDVTDARLIDELQVLCEHAISAEDSTLQPMPSASYEEVLSRSAPVQRVWAGPAYSFPSTLPAGDRAVLITGANADLLRAHLGQWLGDVPTSQPLCGIVVDGAAVAVCASVRQTPRAYEAGVETAPAFRGNGYAGEVVAAWAGAVRARGVAPLYSTGWANTASQAVARKLGLRQYGSDLNID